MTDERERNMDKRRKKENKWERIESCKDKNVKKTFSDVTAIIQCHS